MANDTLILNNLFRVRFISGIKYSITEIIKKGYDLQTKNHSSISNLNNEF
jgi:hypothetical protein